jgi:hypothetical protein
MYLDVLFSGLQWNSNTDWREQLRSVRISKQQQNQRVYMGKNCKVEL